MARDVVLITIDCWRHDAPDRMPELAARVDSEQWIEREAIAQAASTLWVFPQIFASQYHPDVFSIEGRITAEDIAIRSGTDPLPTALSERGYATGGFVASNPNLDVWEPHFDTFANQGLAPFPNASGVRYELDYYGRLLLQKPKVDATTVGKRAREWFRRQEGPRFVWIHLMEPHSPYYPGLKKAHRIGLLDAYRANRRLTRGSKRELLAAEDAASTVETLRELHFAAVERLDERLSAILDSIPEDAAVLVMGDHGEEFHHGWLEHARIYDECVRVPLFARNVEAPGESIRQLDLAPTLFESLDLSRPASWRGRAADGEGRRSYLLEPSGRQLDAIFTGVRTPDRKVIERRNADTPNTVEETEAYDLREDRVETANVYPDDGRSRALRDELHAFLKDIDLTRYRQSDGRDEVSGEVKRRLEELGYR